MYNSQNLPLSPKKVIKKTLAKYLSWFFGVLTILFVIFSLLLRPWGELGVSVTTQLLRPWGELGVSITTQIVIISLFFLILPFVPILVYEYLYYKFYFYDFTQERAKIRKGVISQATGFVRYERLQNIYVDQDILDRIFGLYDVHYETAGEVSGFYSHVDGLNKENADKLTAFLEEKAKQSPLAQKGSEEIAKPEVGPEEIKTGEISIREYPLSKAIITKLTIILLPIFFLAMVSILSIPFYLRIEKVAIFYVGVMSYMRVIFYLFCFVISSVVIFLFNRVWYKNFYFNFGQNKGEIRTKVIGQSISYLYYDRIQNVNLVQDVLDRLFGIYTITIETAGAKAWMKLVIPGLPRESAEKVKDFLLAKAKSYRSRL